jgi:alkylhydroperoxidase family enzyme
MPAVPYVERSALPEDYRYLYDDNENGELNVYRALGNNPELLQSLMRWGTTVVASSGLDRPDAEVVLLATARAVDSQYLWDLHVPLAAGSGLDRSAIRAIGERRFEDLPARREALGAYATAFVDRAVDAAHHDALAEFLDLRAVVGATMMASHFLAVAHAIDALDVDPEGPFVGWSLENG